MAKVTTTKIGDITALIGRPVCQEILSTITESVIYTLTTFTFTTETTPSTKTQTKTN